MFYKGFRYSEEFQKILPASQKISDSLSIVRRIVPFRPDAHLSTVPYVWTMCHPTDQASSVQTTYISVRTFTVSRSYCSSLHPSGRLSSPSGHLSVIDQLRILSKFNLREDCFNRPRKIEMTSKSKVCATSVNKN
jgi:hypothetical protein